MASAHYNNRPQSDSFEYNLEPNERYLDEAEMDHEEQRNLATLAERKYGVTAIENSDGTFSVLEPYNDQAVAVVMWFRECLKITQTRMIPRGLLN
jgi:hypothetical protein